jgi:predicted XRE-type DNA-binding protein
MKSTAKKSTSGRSRIPSAFEELGFSTQESAALERRAELVDMITEYARKKRLSRREMEKLLDEPQPRVSDLMRGKISRFSVEKLLHFCDRLGITVGFKILRCQPRTP